MDGTWTIMVLVVAAIGNVAIRLLRARAFRRLDDDVKLALRKDASGYRVWSVLPLFVLVGLALAGQSVFREHVIVLLVAFLVALVVEFVVVHRMLRTRLARSGAPREYLRTIEWLRRIWYLVLLACMALLLGPAVWRALDGG